MKGFDAGFVERYRARRARQSAGAAPSASSAPPAAKPVPRPGLRPRTSGPVPRPAPPPRARVRVLGIDTSLRCTGLAIVDAVGADMSFVDCRPIPNPARLSLPACLVRIADTLDAYLDEFRPDEVAMEGIFFCKNVRTSLILGHARGVVVATCARRGLPMHEYPPARVKRAVTGSGSATKERMQRMMQAVFRLPDLPQEDSADALAIAMTHLHARLVPGR